MSEVEGETQCAVSRAKGITSSHNHVDETIADRYTDMFGFSGSRKFKCCKSESQDNCRETKRLL